MGFTEKKNHHFHRARLRYMATLGAEGCFKAILYATGHHSHRNLTYHMQMSYSTPHHPRFYDKVI